MERESAVAGWPSKEPFLRARCRRVLFTVAADLPWSRYPTRRRRETEREGRREEEEPSHTAIAPPSLLNHSRRRAFNVATVRRWKGISSLLSPPRSLKRKKRNATVVKEPSVPPCLALSQLSSLLAQNCCKLLLSLRTVLWPLEPPSELLFG